MPSQRKNLSVYCRNCDKCLMRNMPDARGKSGLYLVGIIGGGSLLLWMHKKESNLKCEIYHIRAFEIEGLNHCPMCSKYSDLHKPTMESKLPLDRPVCALCIHKAEREELIVKVTGKTSEELGDKVKKGFEDLVNDLYGDNK